MKIQLQNFGPIEFFEFDTKTQMHFIFGENNVGKSYAISAVYLLLKHLAQPSSKRTNVELIDITKELASIETYVKDKIEENNSVDITMQLENAWNTIFSQTVLIDINNSFGTSFDSINTLTNCFANKKLTICLKFDTVEFILDVNKEGVFEVQSVQTDFITTINNDNKTNLSSEFERTKNKETLKIFCFKDTNKNIDFPELTDGITDWFYENTIIEVSFQVGNVYFLPASRSGLYNALSAFGAIFAELSQSRMFLRSKIELPNIAEPVSDYFLNLSSIRSSDKRNEDLMSIATAIEQNILKGEVVFNSKSKKLSYAPNNLKINLDLSFTSSMISEIAPIVAHLKYVIKKNNSVRRNLIQERPNWLFIEEPEAHLHPRIQVELIKLFVKLSKLGVKIVITSHSNYLFNKLSNLVLAKEIDTKDIEVYHFKMGKHGSYVDAESMKVNVEGIEDANFSDVAEELYSERLELYDHIEL